MTGYPALDLLGKNDKRIASLPAQPRTDRGPWTRFYPGHMKWDYAHSITRLRPGLVLETWPPFGEPPEVAEDHVEARLGPSRYWIRKDSSRLLWDRVARTQSERPKTGMPVATVLH